jgi:phospholipid transport system transporter-binding protein
MFALPETLTLAQAKATVQSIDDALGEGHVEKGALVIDASGLRAFDTSAIAVLLEARRLAQAAGRGIEVRGAPAGMVELSGLYGVAGLLGLLPAAPAQLASLA